MAVSYTAFFLKINKCKEKCDDFRNIIPRLILSNAIVQIRLQQTVSYNLKSLLTFEQACLKVCFFTSGRDQFM